MIAGSADSTDLTSADVSNTQSASDGFLQSGEEKEPPEISLEELKDIKDQACKKAKIIQKNMNTSSKVKQRNHIKPNVRSSNTYRR